MGNSVVDLGAAALDYAEGVWDYMTGAPEASASGGYYKNLGPGARQYFSGPGDYKKTNPVMEYFGFDNGGVASLGAGEPAYIDMGNMDMNSMFATPAQPGDEYYVGEYPGRVYREGDYITEPGYLGPEYEFEVEDPRRFDVYEDSGQFAPPLMDKALEPYVEQDRAGNLGIMASLGKDADMTSPLQAAPEYPGIEGFDIYRDLAPEQFKRRPIDKQNFDKKRGFQYGQMVRLEAMDNKLMKMAGASPQSLGPAAMDQMSDILGREVG